MTKSLNASNREITRTTALMVLLFLFMAFLSFGSPNLIFNEGIYLIKSQQIFDPTFLATDWYVGEQSKSLHGLLFSILVSPLWRLGLNAIEVALFIRAVATLVFLGTILLLLRSLKLPLHPGLLGLSAWVIAGQYGTAGEWVLGGAEQKPFAYAAVLLAITCALQARWFLMALCLSIAIWLHILVGGWSTLALFAALLFRRGLIRPQAWIRAGAIVTVMVAPALILSLHELLTPGAIAEPIPPYTSLGHLLAEFQLPEILDPTVFLTPKKLVKFGLVTLGTYTSLAILPITASAKSLLRTFATFTLLLFGIGLMSFFLKQYTVLNLYPFRLADAFLPLFCDILLPIALIESISSFASMGLRGKSLTIISGVICGYLLLTSLDGIVLHSKDQTLQPWAQSLSSNYHNPKDELYQWIRNNTNELSVFLVPPQWSDFLLMAQRPTFVLLQEFPQTQEAWEWFHRVQLANNTKKFQQRGAKISQELQTNFRLIPKQHLGTLSSEYKIKYYIVDSPRQDLQEYLCVVIADYYVYNISAIPVG